MNSEARQEWNSWEHLILEDLKRIDYRVQRFYSASALFGGNKKDREKFVSERLKELIGESVK